MHISHVADITGGRLMRRVARLSNEEKVNGTERRGPPQKDLLRSSLARPNHAAYVIVCRCRRRTFEKTGTDGEEDEEGDDESDSVGVNVRASAYSPPMEEVCMSSYECVIMVNGVCV